VTEIKIALGQGHLTPAIRRGKGPLSLGAEGLARMSSEQLAPPEQQKHAELAQRRAMEDCATATCSACGQVSSPTALARSSNALTLTCDGHLPCLRPGIFLKDASRCVSIS